MDTHLLVSTDVMLTLAREVQSTAEENKVY